MVATRPRVVISADVAALEDAVAARIATLIVRHQDEARAFRLALAGGRTPRGVHERLAVRTDIDWSQVDVCFGDERLVPPDDPRSNFAMAQQTLFERLLVPPHCVLRVPTELPHDAAAAAYEALLGDVPIDLVILGMGEDGHVASLFPATPEPAGDRRVAATLSPVAPFERVSLTFRALREARHILVVATGLTKSARLRQAFDEIGGNAPRLPLSRVSERDGAWEWHVDAAAASALRPYLEEEFV